MTDPSTPVPSDEAVEAAAEARAATLREVEKLRAIIADLIEGQDAKVGTPHWYALRNARAALRDVNPEAKR